MEVEAARLELAPFVLYQMDSSGSNARCCYEAESTKLICTVVGPEFDSKHSEPLPVIALQLNGLTDQVLDRIHSEYPAYREGQGSALGVYRRGGLPQSDLSD